MRYGGTLGGFFGGGLEVELSRHWRGQDVGFSAGWRRFAASARHKVRSKADFRSGSRRVSIVSIVPR